MRRAYTTLLLLAAVLFLAGCPSIWQPTAPEESPSAETLFKKAEDQFAKKDYAGAIESYERLSSAYPEFDKMSQVHMRIADSYFNQKSYENATARYLQFLDLYPADKQVNRARFQIAMAYFNQIKGIDRDGRALDQATDAFKSLADNAEAGEWAKKAGEKYKECVGKLAERELYKAAGYISLGKYKAARLAAKRVLEKYSKSGRDAEAEALLKKIKGK